MFLEAKETDLIVDDVPESELWDISDLREFRTRLVNGGGVGQIVDFGKRVMGIKSPNHLWRRGEGGDETIMN